MQVDAESAINPYIFIRLAGLAFFFFKQNKKKTFFFVCFVLKSPILSFYFKFGKRNCQSNDSFPLVSGSSKGIIFKL